MKLPVMLSILYLRCLKGELGPGPAPHNAFNSLFEMHDEYRTWDPVVYVAFNSLFEMRFI